MGVLSKGTTYSDGTQVTSLSLNNHVDNATFTSSAVDDTSTQLSSGAIIVKDGGVTTSKLSTGHPNWVATGETIIGHTASVNATGDIEPLNQVHATDQDGAMSATRWSADTGGANLVLAKSRGSAIGTNATVASGDTLGTIVFSSDDGTDLDSSAMIRAICNDTPAANDRPSDLLMYTTGSGDSSPSERLRITSEGRVGVGASNPAVELEVSDADSDCSIRITADNASSSKIDFGDDGDGDIGSIEYDHSDDSMRFITDTTERMRIYGDSIRIGQVSTNTPGTGNTTTGSAFDNTGQVLNISGEGANINRNSDGDAIDFYHSGNSVAGVAVTAAGASYNTTSDYRLKNNVKSLNGSIDRLLRLKPSTFEFKAVPDKIVEGFIAHEVAEIVPSAVTGEYNGEKMQQLDHSKLIPLLTGALQESIVKIDSLQRSIDKLDITQYIGNVDCLKSRINNLNSLQERIDKLNSLQERIDKLEGIQERIDKLDSLQEKIDNLDYLQAHIDKLKNESQ